MKLVTRGESRALIYAAKNSLESNRIDCTIKNEYSVSTGGAEFGIANIYLELWVINDEDLDQAHSIISAKFGNSANKTNWICEQCSEENDGSFDFCWKCQADQQSQ